VSNTNPPPKEVQLLPSKLDIPPVKKPPAYKILLLSGYNIDNVDINKLPSKLIIIGSHTSIYDFFIGILYYYAILLKFKCITF
jgi:hypothetical protein